MATNSCSCQQNPPVVIPPVSPFVCPDECCTQILASTCLIYDGPDIPAFGITTNQSLTQVVQNLALGLGGEEGPSPIYQGDSPSTITVNDIPTGTNIYGYSYDQLFENIYAPFVHPSFASFGITNQVQNVEVGTLVSGTKPFFATYNTIGNVLANTLKIKSVNNNLILASNLPLVGANVNIGNIQLTTPGSWSWRGIATKINNNGDFESETFTINWMYNKYVGHLQYETINEDLMVLLNVFNGLSSSVSGTHYFPTYIVDGNLTYKYLCFPDALGSPNSIKDALGYSVPMATVSQNSFFQYQENGYYYGIVNHTIENVGVIPYRVYRTYNKYGGDIQITVE
jgi:hypothetical protein